MNLLSVPTRAEAVECPYLPDRQFIQEYFFATGLDDHEYGVLLASGWRHFGTFFFRPACDGCRQCIPIRIDADALEPTKSQRRVLKKGTGIQMEAVPPRATDEAWNVYKTHSRSQFNKEVIRDDFERIFFDPAVPALQTEYRLDNKLIGLGFLDVADKGFSSVYFSFNPEFSRYSPGILSILLESTLARLNMKKWYYLGFWVPGNDSMEYKARFLPHQLYDWEKEAWVTPKEHPVQKDMSI